MARERDPENPTEVRPQTAHEVVPPDPVHQDAVNADNRRGDGTDLAPLWAGLRIVGIAVIVLAIVAGPFLAVVAAGDPTTAEAEEFWSIVDAQRRLLGEGQTVRRRLRAAVSLSSFVRVARRSAPDLRGGDAERRRPTT